MTSERALEILREDEKQKSWRELGFNSVSEFNIAYDEAYELALKALEFIIENYPETFKDYLNGEQYRE